MLTWDPRGFGDSGGEVTVDGPDTDGRDVQALVTWLAAQPEAQLDAAGDPRVGMEGESYGGGIQLVAAAVDPRIDVIAPRLAWHDLPEALTPGGAFKLSWLTLLGGAGEIFGRADGYDAQPGPQLGGQDAHLLRYVAVGAATGTPLPDDTAWMASRGPAQLLDRVRIPTLLAQSTADTLFPLAHATRTFEQLRDQGTPVRMVWYCGGGHGACPTPGGGDTEIRRLELDWFARYLRDDTSAPEVPAFSWVADDGLWRSAPGWPLPGATTLRGSGSGKLTLAAGYTGTGLPFGAGVPPTITMPKPDPRAIRVALSQAAGDALVAGAPKLRLTYRGFAVPAATRIYASLATGNRIVGFQARPVPVVLDGSTRSVDVTLEHVAVALSPDTRLRVELAAGTPVFAPQRSTGTFTALSAAAELAVSGPQQ